MNARSSIMAERGVVLKQLLLAILVILQITMAPIILFSLTYLVDVDYEGAQVGIRTEHIHWVAIAGLSYGGFSIALALIFGGFMPYFVVNRGGWLSLLRLSPRSGDPELVDRSRLHLQGTPYGMMARLVNSKTRDGDFDLMAVHGGLQLLAVPMQVFSSQSHWRSWKECRNLGSDLAGLSIWAWPATLSHYGWHSDSIRVSLGIW